MTLEYNDKLKISQRVSMLYTNYEALIDVYHNLFTLDWDDTLVIEQYDSTAKLGSQTIPNYHLDLNNMFLNGDSNPNGVKEGSVGQMYIDTETKILYVCTANGLNSWTNILTEADLTIHNYSSTAHIYSLARANGSQKQVFKTKDTNLTNTVPRNYTVHGTPTSTGSIVSGFSSSNYLEADYTFNTTSPWEVTTQIRTGQDISTLQYIEGCLDTSGSWGVLFGIENNQPKLLLSSNGTSWDISSGLTGLNLSLNTSYIFKYGWSGTQYYIKRSVDEGITYTTDNTLVSTFSIHSCGFYLGTGGNKTNYFLGSLDLSKFSIYVNSQKEFPQIDYINDYLMINRKYLGNKDNLTTANKSSLVDALNVIKSTLLAYIEYLTNIQFPTTISSSSGNVNANGDPYIFVDLGEAFYYEDKTPVGTSDNATNVNYHYTQGESEYYHWQSNQGCFGYDFSASGSQQGFNATNYMYTYGAYDGAAQMGSGIINTIIHTFPTPLEAGTYKFKVAAGYGRHRNGAMALFTESDFNLFVTIHNSITDTDTEEEITLPTDLQLTSWKETAKFTVPTGSTLVSIKVVCNWASRVAYCGSGIVHLIKVIPNSSFENTVYFNVGSEYPNLIYQDKDNITSEITYINSIPIKLDSSGSTNRYVEQSWVQPTLYSNGSLGGNNFAVEASTYEGSTTIHPAWGAFNSTSGEDYEWWSDLDNSYFTIYNPTPIKITNISALLSSNFGNLNYGISSCNIEGSNNGTDWTLIKSLNNLSGSAGTYQNLGLETNTTYYNYYRISSIKTINAENSGPRIKDFYITATEKFNLGDNTYKVFLPKNSNSARLTDCEFYRQQNQPYQFNKVGDVSIQNTGDTINYYKYQYETWTQPVLTSDTSYGSLSTTSQYNNQAPWYAFRGVVDTGGYLSNSTSGGDITWHLPNEKIKISSCKLYNNTSGSYYGRFPLSITMLGSNDGTNYTQIGTLSDYTLPSAGASVTVTCDNTTAYEYIKWVFGANNGTWPGVQITNIEITAQKQSITAGTSSDYDFYTTETGGLIATNFSSRNTITPYKLLTPASKTWEIETKIKTGSNVTTGQAIFGSADNVDYKIPHVCISSGKYSLYISSNGSSWNIASAVNGTYTIPTNSIEKIKFGWDGEKYYVKNWQDEETISQLTSALPSASDWYSVAYGDETYVAVAYNSNSAPYSTDGSTWTTSTLPVNQNWTKVFYGNGKFIALAEESTIGAYSTDGITWTPITLPSDEAWYGGAYGNGKYVITGNMTSTGAYSTDGITWTSMNMPSSQTWECLAYGNDKFVSVVFGTDVFAYSTDGITWTQGTLPSTEDWTSITYGNGKFIAVADSSTTGIYSTDGVTWNTMTLPSSAQWKSVYYGKDRFVAIAYNSNAIAYSNDGITWTGSTLTSTLDYSSITYGNKFVAVAENTQTVVNLDYNYGWVTDISVSSTTPIYATTNKLAIGNNLYSSSSQEPFLGSLFLEDTKITIDNQLYWDYETGEYVWENTSVLPTTIQKHTTEWGDYSDILLGTVTTEQGMISDVQTLPYNTKYRVNPNNTVPAEIIQCYKNGSTWYNLYSDGWIEIYGTANISTTGLDINLPIRAMKGNTYLVETCCTAGYAYITQRTTTLFSIKGSTTASCNWKVSGYIA